MKRLHGLTLLAYPRGFREAFGDEMRQVFEDRTSRGSVWLGIFLLFDTILSGLAERVRQRRGKSTRDKRTIMHWLDSFALDVKLGGRMLVKYPGLTVIGGLAMAFAIWVGLVILQVLGLFTHPTLPLSQGARLVELRLLDVSASKQEKKILRDFLDWQQSVRSVTEIGAWRNSSRNLVIDDDARPVNVAEMSASGFRVSDGMPLMGRMLAEADEQPAAPAVAVIGYEVWRTRFGSDPHVLGRTVQLGNAHATVVGVMREGFEFPVSHDVWMPLKTASLAPKPRSGPSMTVFALLAPGESLRTAQAELTAAGRRAAAEFPATHQHLEPRVRPYALLMVPDDTAATIILSAVYVFVALLLILVCGNVGLLLFARAASREADLVVRTALGASRGRIVAQMFAEALVLGGVAAIAGLIAADVTLRTWATAFLETNLGRLPFWFDLGLSPRAFVQAIALTVAAAAIAGVMPARRITRGMGDRLKQTTAGSGGLHFGGVWTVVIVAQVAATVIFPAAVYWVQGQLHRVEDFDPGFANEQYLSVQIERDYPNDGGANIDADTRERNAGLTATIEELRRRMAEQPGVRGVTFTEYVPTTNRPQKAIELGDDVTSGGSGASALRVATVGAVDPSYFEVLDARVLAGRGFSPADAMPGSRVAIVDQGFVDQILQGRNAIGQQVRFLYPGPPTRPWTLWNPNNPGNGHWYEVIGVVRELGAGSPLQPGRAAGFYVPAPADLFDEIHMLVHVRGGDPMALAPRLRDVAAAVDPSLRLVNVQRANEVNNGHLLSMGLWQRITVLMSSVAIVLSLAGIFAVLSFTVSRRTREIGVRVALGASRTRVIGATFRRPLLQVIGGIVVGTAIVFAVAIRLKYSEFPGSETELTFRGMAMILGYGIVMLGVCMLGCIVPTRRALNIEPTIALRTE